MAHSLSLEFHHGLLFAKGLSLEYLHTTTLLVKLLTKSFYPLWPPLYVCFVKWKVAILMRKPTFTKFYIKLKWITYTFISFLEIAINL